MMQKMTEQNKRLERQSIVRWILTLEQRQKLLEVRFEGFEERIYQMLIGFIRAKGLDENGDPSGWRKKASRKEIQRIRAEIDLMLDEGLTDRAIEEVEKIILPKKMEIADIIGIMVALETIKVTSHVEVILTKTFVETVESELERQIDLIGLDRQYIKNHIDDVMQQGIYEQKWSENIWGIYQKRLRDSVTQLVRESIIRGYNPKKIAQILEKEVSATKYECERLMRTEQARVQAYSQLESYKAQGIKFFELVPEPTACPECKKVARGNPYLVEDVRVGENMHPIHPNCRCSTVGVVERE